MAGFVGNVLSSIVAFFASLAGLTGNLGAAIVACLILAVIVWVALYIHGNRKQ